MCIQKLTEERLYKLKGYLDILEKGRPNGATIHMVKNHITALRICIRMEVDLMPGREEKIRDTIRRMYSEDVREVRE